MDKGGWEDENEKAKNKRCNAPDEMGMLEHNGIKCKLAEKKEEYKRYLFYTNNTHTEALNIIGKATAIK